MLGSVVERRAVVVRVDPRRMYGRLVVAVVMLQCRVVEAVEGDCRIVFVVEGCLFEVDLESLSQTGFDLVAVEVGQRNRLLVVLSD